MSEHYSGDYTIEYPNEPYFIKVSEGEQINTNIEGADENSVKLFKYLYEISKEEQEEAMGLHPILEATELNSMEFYKALLELMKSGNVEPDFISATPARVLILKNK